MNSSNIINLANDRVVTTTISHELKTPLNAIIGFTDLILEEESINIIKDYADIIKNNSKTLLEKIHNVIDYNSLEHDCSIFLEKVEVPKMVEIAKKIIEKEFEKYGRDFKISCDSSLLNSPSVIFVDKVKLEKCFYHILSSVRHFSKNGQVIVEFRKDNIGDEESIMLSLLFDQEFMSKNLEDGIGLHLAISDKLSKLVGGCMIIELNNDSKIIAFELPVKNRYKNIELYFKKLVVLVVEDDYESFVKISRNLTGNSKLVLRTSEAEFIEGAADCLAETAIVIINSGEGGGGMTEAIRRVKERNPNTLFLINIKNHECLSIFSHNYKHVLWFTQATLKNQIKKIIDIHYKNKCDESS